MSPRMGTSRLLSWPRLGPEYAIVRSPCLGAPLHALACKMLQLVTDTMMQNRDPLQAIGADTGRSPSATKMYATVMHA